MATLTLMLKGRELKNFSLGEKRLLIGRNPDCDVFMDNVAVSRQHAGIEFSNGKYILGDLGSANGTFVNGRRLGGDPVILSPGDAIQIGKFELLFQDSAPTQPFQTRPDGMDETMIFTPKPAGDHPSSSQEKVARKLSLVSGKANQKKIYLRKDITTIGKAPDCDLVVPGLFVSKIQAVILDKGDGYYVLDKGFLVSTRLNGQKTKGHTLLANGDAIQMGKTELLFS